ncbi:hypothetical protein SAMN02745181_3073 [Rubritalea squalenifaciens DSM 18772]|uniref:Uncharacterized protein n=1 Tax=Rubritalea squalenifaciens DSM 18772 TaxID=1123071 RepID=A0A1M6P4I8_9BACT|nr:hypothetical protein [Rubritalea squalenifaciens]SHK02885.1 hypothetical protein SAMN02745181_3073 [Rubritalea squalenifaciens DSM 18772]
MASIPERRRDQDEIAQLRMRNAMQMRPPVQHYQRKLASPLILWPCYLFSLLGLGVVIGPLLFIRKPLSRHHAALMIIVSVIVLLSVSLWSLNYLKKADGDLPSWVPEWVVDLDL